MLPKDFEGWMPDRPYRGVQGHFYAFLPGYAGFLEYYDVVWAQSAVPGSNVPETLYERPSHMYHEALESGIRIGNLHLKMMAAARPHCPREHGRGIQLRALWESLPAGLKSETVLMLRIYRFSYREWPQEVHATVVVTNS